MLSNHKKLVVIGDTNTGKTSFITKYLYNIFSEDYVKTPRTEVYWKGVDLKVSEFIPSNSNVINWSYGGCDGVIIIYDVHNQDSYNHVDDWLNEARRYTNSPIIICGTKSDIPNGNFYNNNQVPTFIISAKTGDNINIVREHLLKYIKLDKHPTFFY